MDRVGVVLDFFNFENGLGKRNNNLNYRDFLNYLGDLEEGRKLIDAYAYFKLDYTNENSNRLIIENIEQFGFLPKTKILNSKEEEENKFYQLELTIDVLKFVEDLNIDILVFISNDTMFYPLLKALRDRGIRVELVSIDNFENEKLKGIAQGVISIDEFLDKELEEEENGNY